MTRQSEAFRCETPVVTGFFRQKLERRKKDMNMEDKKQKTLDTQREKGRTVGCLVCHTSLGCKSPDNELVSHCECGLHWRWMSFMILTMTDSWCMCSENAEVLNSKQLFAPQYKKKPLVCKGLEYGCCLSEARSYLEKKSLTPVGISLFRKRDAKKTKCGRKVYWGKKRRT